MDSVTDILAYFKLLIRAKYIIVVVFILSILGSFFINNHIRPIYVASVTFYIPQLVTVSNSGLGGYLTNLGDSTVGLREFIIALVKSEKIQDMVIKDVSIKEKVNDDVLRLHLKLGKTTEVKKLPGGILVISFENDNKILTSVVLMSYIKSLNLINKEFNLSSNKNLVEIIDSPKIPKNPSKPKRKLNTILITSLSLLITFFTVFIYGKVYQKI